MSDEHLRRLERLWQESESAEDEAAWLLALVRSGSLSREHLELAACVGSVGAQLALEGEPSATEDPVVVVHALIDRNSRVGVGAALAASSALARACWDGASSEVESVLAALSEEWLSGTPSAPLDLREAFTPLHSGGKRNRKRQEEAVAALDSARSALQGLRRTLRVRALHAVKLAKAGLGNRSAVDAIRAFLLPRLRGGCDLVEPCGPPTFLLTVTERFSIQGRGVLLHPEVDLEGQTFMDFTVELRASSAPPIRCRATTSIPRVTPYDPNNPPAHVLLVPLEKELVPIGTEVWEVGP